MDYIITVKNKNETHHNVLLQNRTEVGSKILWLEKEYKVNEIIIVDPDENVIELKCSDITKPRKPIRLITHWS